MHKIQYPQIAYLAVGQSNMVYRGTYTQVHTGGPHGICFLAPEADGFQWRFADLPQQFMEENRDADGNPAGIGIPYHFGVAMQQHHGGGVGVIDCALGGQNIDYFLKGAIGYSNMLLRAQAALECGVRLGGIIWLQGESDCPPDRAQAAQQYAALLAEMVSTLRKDLSEPALPFIAGEIGRYCEVFDNYTNYPLVQAQIQLAAQCIPNAALVTSEGLAHRGDGLHLSPDAQAQYAGRFAQAMAGMA